MRSLLTSTCLLAVTAGLVSPASAQTVISTAVTTPVATGTANQDIRITSTGSVKPASGVAVTINSNNSVANEGAIAIQGANDSAGIVALPGFAGNITNSGSITIDENYTATDTDSDGDLDGPFAQGSGRYGIRVLPGGTFTGNITNSGNILVEGNQSAGIAIDSALVGNLANSGNITVIGNDSFGIRAGDVTGNVTLSKGSISVQGQNSVGVSLTGDIGGALVIQNSVTVTGYRVTTPPADTSKLDADDLLQGGSAVVISGDVAGGILFDARPADNSTTDTDEDDDGIPDAQETTAAITTLGSAPAVRIGSSTEATTIGAVGSSAAGHGLVVKGSITGNGLYTGVAGNGLVIGGTGQDVTIAGGMTVQGTIAARANGATATAIRIGSGADVPVVAVTGSVTAQGGGAASAAAQAIVIEEGANVTTLTNSGNILVTRSGTEGSASAIVDEAGTLTLIENKGAIGVANAEAVGDTAVAFDLRANTAGVTLNQLAVASGVNPPAILGDVLLGSGNDVVNVADGSVAGDIDFGTGTGTLALSGDAVIIGDVDLGSGADSVTLAGTSRLVGALDLGDGADVLTLGGTSLFRGALTGGAGTAVALGAGTTLDLTNTGTVDLASLTTGAGSTVGVTLNSTTGAITLYNVAGAASFGENTTISVNLLNVGGVDGTYKIIDAGTLSGFDNLSSAVTDLPFLFASSLSLQPGEVLLSVDVKSAQELGLNASEASVLDAALEAADEDNAIASIFLNAEDGSDVRSTLQQLLPEHAGGAFENVTKGSRLVSGILSDPRSPIMETGGLGLWLQQVAWGNSKSIGATSSYDLTGWGAAAGVERRMGGLGSLGVSVAFLSGKDSNNENELISNAYEGGIYWRGGFGPVNAFARATTGTVKFDGTRTFQGTLNGSAITRSAEGKWDGSFYSATGGVSYEMRMNRLSLRPLASIEYYKLDEDGYVEAGGGEAFDLTVRDRKSNETAANATLTVGYDLMSLDAEQPWLRVELEGGRREIISGSLGATTASFGEGTAFTLTPEERTSGFRGALRLLGGGPSVGVTAEVGAEEQQGAASLGGRIGVRFAL